MPRDALVVRLAAGVSCRLVLVCAPAGWGKSVLLAQWRARRARAPAVRVGLARPVRRRPRALLELRHRGAADGRARVRRRACSPRCPNAGPGADRGRAAAADQRARGAARAGRARARRLPPAARRARARVGRLPAAARAARRCSSRSPPASTRRCRSRACARPASWSSSARTSCSSPAPRPTRCSTARSRSDLEPRGRRAAAGAHRGLARRPAARRAVAARPQRPRARSSARSPATTARSATTCTR